MKSNEENGGSLPTDETVKLDELANNSKSSIPADSADTDEFT